MSDYLDLYKPVPEEEFELNLWRERLSSFSKGLQEFWKMFRTTSFGVIGLGIIVGFLLIAIFAPILAPYPPLEMRVGGLFEPPSRSHLLGTTDVGEDIFSQIIWGSRISLTVGFVAAATSSGIGVLVGLVSGFYGRRVDSILMRITDIILILPGLPLMILLAAYLGPSMWNIVLVITLVYWGGTARLIRSQVLSLKELAYVEACRAVGASNPRIMFRHILPNLSGLILANMVFSVVGAILTEAGLSFLGLGDPTHTSWGMMLHMAMTMGGFVRRAWWWVIPPGLCITVIGLAFTFVGYSLDEIFNPRLRQR